MSDAVSEVTLGAVLVSVAGARASCCDGCGYVGVCERGVWIDDG